MPEYLAPGVFIEETSFRQKTIEGVSTSTTGFVGPARFGPTEGEPSLLTSFSDFERIYGGLDQLRFDDQSGQDAPNYLAHAVRAYFEEGGKRLYVSRVFKAPADGDAPDEHAGKASWTATGSPEMWGFRARYPGRAGNLTVRITFNAGNNIRTTQGTLAGARPYDVVLADGQLRWVDRVVDPQTGAESFRLRTDAPSGEPTPASPPDGGLENVLDVRVLTATVTIPRRGRFDDELVWEDLTFSQRHRDPSFASVFAEKPTSLQAALIVPLVLVASDATLLENGAALAGALLSQKDDSSILDALNAPIASSPTTSTVEERTLVVELHGGSDGDLPGPGEYAGQGGEKKSGLQAFEDLEDISIVAAPGSTDRRQSNIEAITASLISHCERMRYRIAVLDSADGDNLSAVQDRRARIDSTRAALYYPWVRIFDPVTEAEILQPPSGFICGVYARNDVERGVHKAPANEVLRLAIGSEFFVNKGQQEVLNPKGINCLRFFEGRGYRVWGARTVTSDPEWKYVNVRRYFAFLERSIEKGTQWAVFENNGEVLWANIRRTVEDFLFNEWKENHLMGTKPEQAFFVRCDRTTMTQNDIDNGRLICLIGVAPLRPAEFVIFRIGQKTADA